MLIGCYNKSVILTYAGVACAVVGTYFAFAANRKAAILCLIAAGICDLFDGAVARRCKRTQQEKQFGVQIDSLCDVVNFLILPVAVCIGSGMTRAWQLAAYVLFVLAGITRLAYFNIIADSNAPVKYYRGLPVTFSALIFSVLTLLASVFFRSAAQIILPCGLLLTGVLFVMNIKLPKPGKKAIIVFAIIGLAGACAIAVLV